MWGHFQMMEQSGAWQLQHGSPRLVPTYSTLRWAVQSPTVGSPHLTAATVYQAPKASEHPIASRWLWTHNIGYRAACPGWDCTEQARKLCCSEPPSKPGRGRMSCPCTCPPPPRHVPRLLGQTRVSELQSCSTGSAW